MVTRSVWTNKRMDEWTNAADREPSGTLSPAGPCLHWHCHLLDPAFTDTVTCWTPPSPTLSPAGPHLHGHCHLLDPTFTDTVTCWTPPSPTLSPAGPRLHQHCHLLDPAFTDTVTCWTPPSPTLSAAGPRLHWHCHLLDPTFTNTVSCWTPPSLTLSPAGPRLHPLTPPSRTLSPARVAQWSKHSGWTPARNNEHTNEQTPTLSSVKSHIVQLSSRAWHHVSCEWGTNLLQQSFSMTSISYWRFQILSIWPTRYHNYILGIFSGTMMTFKSKHVQCHSGFLEKIF